MDDKGRSPVWCVAIFEPIVSLAKWWDDDNENAPWVRLWHSYIVLPRNLPWMRKP